MLQDCEEEVSFVSENDLENSWKRNCENDPIVFEERSSPYQDHDSGQYQITSCLGKNQNNFEGVDMFTFVKDGEQLAKEVMVDLEFQDAGPVYDTQESPNKSPSKSDRQ